MSEQKDWKTLESSLISDIDVLNGIPYEECNDLQRMLFHIIRDYQLKYANLKNEIDKNKTDILHLQSIIEKIK